MVKRILLQHLEKDWFQKKIFLIYGPRQTGKTTILNQIKQASKEKTLYLNCDEPDIRALLKNSTSTVLKNIIGDNKLILIDEAQRVENIGITLKLMIDQISNIQILATGSSVIDLSNKINEPLTGRKFQYTLLPISTEEMINHSSYLEEKRLLSTRLIYGMYPDIINNPGKEQKILNNLSGSYLYKDIFSFQDIRKPEVLEKLLQALALQIGSPVSYNELANTVGMDIKSIMRYLDLLEKSFVIFRLKSLSRNLRTELKKSRKIYFYDNGIRNALISNFNSIDMRTDIGGLWENFIISERMKLMHNRDNFIRCYFWRTKQHQEVDYIEEKNGILSGFEIKWNKNKKNKFPNSFLNAYPNSKTKIISTDNYMEFLT